ncbi:MAG: cupredoxin domain-containing protein [Sphingosinicella sp.]
MHLWLLPLLVAASGAAAQPDTRTVEVQLSSFRFEPRTLRLAAGQPVTLRLVNSGRGGHNFSAPEFFAAARGSRPSGGAVEVPSRSTVNVSVIPARGRYRLRCTHTLHSTLGMRGQIIVE